MVGWDCWVQFFRTAAQDGTSNDMIWCGGISNWTGLYIPALKKTYENIRCYLPSHRSKWQWHTSTTRGIFHECPDYVINHLYSRTINAWTPWKRNTQLIDWFDAQDEHHIKRDGDFVEFHASLKHVWQGQSVVWLYYRTTTSSYPSADDRELCSVCGCDWKHSSLFSGSQRRPSSICGYALHDKPCYSRFVHSYREFPYRCHQGNSRQHIGR